MKFQVLFLFCFVTLQSTTKARTVGVQTLGDYTHESIQEIDDGPITHTFLGPDGFNRTIVTGPDVNSVSSLSDASGVTFTISAPDGSQMQTIGPLKSKGISNVVSSSSSVSDIKIIGQSSGSSSNSGSDPDSEVFEISPPNARVFDPCFPFCTEEILLVREPTRPYSRPPTDQPPPPPPPPPSKAPPPLPAVAVILKSSRTGTEKPSPAANILRTCFPFCDPN